VAHDPVHLPVLQEAVQVPRRLRGQEDRLQEVRRGAHRPRPDGRECPTVRRRRHWSVGTCRTCRRIGCRVHHFRPATPEGATRTRCLTTRWRRSAGGAADPVRLPQLQPGVFGACRARGPGDGLPDVQRGGRHPPATPPGGGLRRSPSAGRCGRVRTGTGTRPGGEPRRAEGGRSDLCRPRRGGAGRPHATRPRETGHPPPGEADRPRPEASAVRPGHRGRRPVPPRRPVERRVRLPADDRGGGGRLTVPGAPSRGRSATTRSSTSSATTPGPTSRTRARW
jgi:hypothetical protein